MPFPTLRSHWLLPGALITLACNPSAFRANAEKVSQTDAGRAGSDAHDPDAGTSMEQAGGGGELPTGATAGAGAGDRPAKPAAGAPAAEGGKVGAAGTAAGAGGGSAGSAAVVCERADPNAAVQLISTHEMGAVAQPEAVALRVPGPITWIGGGKLVWLFPKTQLRMPMPAVAGAPSNHPSAAFTFRKDPGKLDESLISGVPASFVGVDSASPDSELWPTALLRLPPDAQGQATTGALAILQRVAADFSYDVLTTRLAMDELSAHSPPLPLFTGDEPKFSMGGYRGAEYSYLFACTEDPAVADRGDPKRFPCTLARAAIADMEKHEAWRVYRASDGQWLADLKAGEPVIYGPHNALSVSYNKYLGRYLAVYSRWFSNEIVIQSAERVLGPWRTELTINAPEPVDGVVQFALEQPSLNASECESMIWISYLSPRAMSDGFPSEGEIKLIQAELR